MFNANRLVYKDGQLAKSIFKYSSTSMTKDKRYHQDLYAYLVSVRWLVVIFFISAAYISTWLIFALLWYALSIRNGDFAQNRSEENIPCIHNIHNDFIDFFMFSLETQSTIGFGHYYPTNACRGSVFILALQSSVGVLISVCTAGIVLNRIMRPKQREKFIKFSDNAVVSKRDGKLCFMICIANPFKVLITSCSVQLLYIEKKKNSDGDEVPSKWVEMSTANPSYKEDGLFLCPSIIEHIIDETSPLYGFSFPLTFGLSFEIVVLVEGTLETTGEPCHYRTSYLPSEMLWGFRFHPIDYKITKENEIYFDSSSIDEVEILENIKETNGEEKFQLVSRRIRTFSDWNDTRNIKELLR